jgi:hypothetical protein
MGLFEHLDRVLGVPEPELEEAEARQRPQSRAAVADRVCDLDATDGVGVRLRLAPSGGADRAGRPAPPPR